MNISEKIKNDFPFFEKTGVAYLDSAATSQTPQVVLDAMEAYYTIFRANVHRGLYGLSAEATERFEGARETIAQFIGASKEEIIFTGSATMSSNLLTYALENTLELREGDEILLSAMEHHSSIVPLQELAQRKKLKLVYIPLAEGFALDYKEAKRLITPRTKIVAVMRASNVLGTINDVRAISQTARKNGAIMIVDATSAAGHAPLSVKDLDCDYLYFSGHKMCGPTGIGVLYGRRDFLEKLYPGFFGGGMIDRVTREKSSWREVPGRFEAGTPPIAEAIGLAAAAEYINEIGFPAIREQVEDVFSYARETLSRIPNVSIYARTDARENAGILSFTIKGVHPHDAAEILSRENVAIRAGHHCAEPLLSELGETALCRASFYFYNTRGDADRLAAGIKKAKATLRA
ncbi:cysteine desulfurase [bacterium]|nr:cysteine desulfurase [bacterium]